MRQPAPARRECQRRRWSLAAAACGLVVALCAAAPLAVAQECIEYEPSTCWFALPADPKKEPIVFPRCAFHDCEFDHAAALVCPFPSSGTFTVTDKKDCRDFMKVEERQLPTCKEACCGGVQPGNFTHPEDDPATYDYRADSAAGCQYFDYRRQEVVDKLLGEGIDIVVAGDSMMRQNYLRLLQLMRGRRRIFDYRVHTHASYSYCDEVDSFRTASYMADMKQPEKQYLLDVVPEFFDHKADKAKKGALSKCSRDVGRLDFLHAPLFATHGAVVEAYLKAAEASGRKLVIISYVGVWTKVANVPEHYFQTMENIANHPPGAAVISISVPTLKEIRAPERAAKYRERNSKMRAWVETHPGKAAFLDFESLSLTPGAPPNTRNDKHYMCYVTWPQEGRGGPSTASLRKSMLEVNSFRERLYDNPIGNLWMTEDGECYDEMNRALWMVGLNTIMQAKTTRDGGFELPRAFGTIPPPIYAREETGLTASELVGSGDESGAKSSSSATSASGSGGRSGSSSSGSSSSSSGGDSSSSSSGGSGSSSSSSSGVGSSSGGMGLEDAAAATKAGGDEMSDVKLDSVRPRRSSGASIGGGSSPTDSDEDAEEAEGEADVAGAADRSPQAGAPKRSSNNALEGENEVPDEASSELDADDDNVAPGKDVDKTNGLRLDGDGLTLEDAEEEESDSSSAGGGEEAEGNEDAEADLAPADVSDDITDEIDDSEDAGDADGSADDGDEEGDGDEDGDDVDQRSPSNQQNSAAVDSDEAGSDALAVDAAEGKSEARVNDAGEAMGEADFEAIKVAKMEEKVAASGGDASDGSDGGASADQDEGGGVLDVDGETAPLVPEDEN